MNRRSLFAAAILLIWTVGCTGASGHMKFSDLQYPASLSPALYSKNDTVLLKDRGLQVVGKFSYEKRFWGIFYSWIRLSGSSDVDQAMNEAIQKAHGHGMINVNVTESTCGYNIGFGLLFTLVPLVPGCVNTVIEGEIVKAR